MPDDKKCIDCGKKLRYVRTLRCSDCHSKRRKRIAEKRKEPVKRCIDCDKGISKNATRCNDCNYEFIRDRKKKPCKCLDCGKETSYYATRCQQCQQKTRKRNVKSRFDAICELFEYYNVKGCGICGWDKYIIVHHMVEYNNKSVGKYLFDPWQMFPLCPNCHVLIHQLGYDLDAKNKQLIPPIEIEMEEK